MGELDGKTIHDVVDDFVKIGHGQPYRSIENAGWWGRFGAYQVSQRRKLEAELAAAKRQIDQEQTIAVDLQTRLDSSNILIEQLNYKIKEISEIHGGPEMANCITENRKEAREWALKQTREWLQKSSLSMLEAFDDTFPAKR